MDTQTTVPCAQAEDSGLLCQLQSPHWVKVCLVSTVFFHPVSVVPRVEKCLGLSVRDRVLCLTVCLFLSAFLTVAVSLWLSVCLSVCQSPSLPLLPSRYASVCECVCTCLLMCTYVRACASMYVDKCARACMSRYVCARAYVCEY